MKIYMSVVERPGPQLRFVEDILLEYKKEDRAIIMYYTKESAIIAARVIYTILYHAEDDASVTVNDNPISLKKMSVEDIDVAGAIDHQEKSVVVIRLSRRAFETQRLTIMVAANDDVEAM
jgi:hypothetical protein